MYAYTSAWSNGLEAGNPPTLKHGEFWKGIDSYGFALSKQQGGAEIGFQGGKPWDNAERQPWQPGMSEGGSAPHMRSAMNPAFHVAGAGISDANPSYVNGGHNFQFCDLINYEGWHQGVALYVWSDVNGDGLATPMRGWTTPSSRSTAWTFTSPTWASAHVHLFRASTP